MSIRRLYIFAVMALITLLASLENPFLGIIVGCLLFFFRTLVFPSRPGATPDSGAPHVVPTPITTFSRHLQGLSLGELQRRHPTFREADFIARMRRVFSAVHGNGPAGEPGAIQVFFADGVSEQFALRRREILASTNSPTCSPAQGSVSGGPIRFRNLTVSDCRTVGLQLDEQWIKIFLAFKATIEAVAIPVASEAGSGVPPGGVFRGGTRDESVEIRPLDEVWTCVRRAGGQLDKGDGLTEGNCPECGEQARAPREIHCHSCGGIYRSGEGDWVLAEVIPAHEWSEPRRPEIPGLSRLLDRDPQFQVLQIRDLVTTIFYRWRWAVRSLDIDALRPFLPGQLEHVPPLSEKTPAGGSPGLEQPTLFDIRLLGIRQTSARDQDQILVRMAWSGRPTSGEAGEFAMDLDESIHRRWGICVLARPGLAHSTPEAIFNSSSWATMQALIQQDLLTRSGRIIRGADPQRGWLIDAILTHTDPGVADILEDWAPTLHAEAEEDHPEAREARDSGLGVFARSTRLQTLRAMICMSLVRGRPSDSQMDFLQDFAKTCDVTPDGLSALREAIECEGNLRKSIRLPAGIDEATALLQGMTVTALADGEMTTRERDFLVQVGADLSFQRKHVEKIIQREQERLRTFT